MLFAYVGPEVMMPVWSIVAAGVGMALLFGRAIMSFGRGIARRIWPFSKKPEPPAN
jgi:hypothetical protein